MADGDKIFGETLLELERKEPEGDKDGHVLRVVQWKAEDGSGNVRNMGGPQLSKQILTLDDETGEIQGRKQKGLRKQEWQLIKTHFDKIDAILDPPQQS